MKYVTAIAGLALLAGCPSAEPTDFRVRIENMSRDYDFLKSGVFDMPLDSDVAGPIRGGESYEVTFTAPPGSRLSFAMMFGQSNDLFLAPGPEGIELYVGREPTSGDLTDQVKLWDAGTEKNREPGTGADQPVRQDGPGMGEEDEDGTVRPVVDAGGLPEVAEFLKVTLEPGEDGRFVLRLKNISDQGTLQTSEGPVELDLSRGVWVIHDEPNALFKPGEPTGAGLEKLAEEGDPKELHDELKERTGITVDLSPGVFAVFNEDNPIYMEGRTAGLLGLEDLAEAGDPTALEEGILQARGVQLSGSFSNTERTPIGPGEAYEFTISGSANDRFTFATMFAQSNDLFFAPENERGIDLFDLTGKAVSGNVTDKIALWDAGTERNQDLGAGPDQAPFQTEANVGARDEDTRVRKVDPSEYRDLEPIARLIKVTLVPVGTREDEGVGNQQEEEEPGL